jgi:uncharacterized protein (DUF983 family)
MQSIKNLADELREPCPRCGDAKTYKSCSIFNTQMICLNCIKKEREHPDFERARETEIQAVRRGDYNFPGIGKPSDL